MKRLHTLTLLTLVLLTFSCKSRYVFPQSDLGEYPCETREKGVNVRILNNGKFDFSKFVLKLAGKDLVFSGLKPREKSCYKNTSYIWTNNSHEIWFYRTQTFGQKTLSMGVDHIGEMKIDSGFVTLEIKTTGTFKNPKHTIRIIKN